MKAIPIYEPSLDGNEKKYVLDCIESSWISSKGKYVRYFEEAVENYIENVHASSCANGTVALHLALLALDIGPGDEVIVPTFTYIASVNAIKYVGATPVFVDCDPYSWNSSINEIRDSVTSATKAILCVHLYGVPCELLEIHNFAKANNIKVIEDCAEAMGTIYKGVHVGANSDISTLSFFGNKTITTGEGGMVFSKDISLIERVNHLKNQGVSSTIQYWHDCIGYNYRMTNIAAAIGLAQMERITAILESKFELGMYYKETLEPKGVQFQVVPSDSRSSYWLNVAKFQSEAVTQVVTAGLKSNGVEVRPGFPLVSEMPPYKGISNHQFPNAELISKTSICLPSFPGISFSDVDFICSIVLDNCNGE